LCARAWTFRRTESRASRVDFYVAAYFARIFDFSREEKSLVEGERERDSNIRYREIQRYREREIDYELERAPFSLRKVRDDEKYRAERVDVRVRDGVRGRVVSSHQSEQQQRRRRGGGLFEEAEDALFFFGGGGGGFVVERRW
jgi:hypothetical protein